MFSFRNPSTIILALASLQVLCATYFLYIPNFYAINTFLFLICGIGIGICLLNISALQFLPLEMLNRQLLAKLIFVALLLPFSYQLARVIMDQTPLQIEYADMLPIMKTMCRRFLNGQWKQVYAPIPEIWNGIQPIYLPAMWLPFTSALVLDFDLRWVTVCGIWLSVIVCLLPAWKKEWRPILLIATLLALLIWFHLDGGSNVIRLTEEGVVYFYYAALAAAIITANPWLLGVSIALCLLSRYALVGWIPFAVLYLVMIKQYMFLLKTIFSSTILILLILILPFGVNPLLFHLHLQNVYVSQATRVWHDHPEFYYHSLGFAKFFGPDHVRLLHFILTCGTFLIPLIFLFLVRKKILTRPNILLAGFQLSITFFYNFLDVSYLYLFYTPVFVSLVIAGWSLSSQPLKMSAFVNTSQ
jgi:hypothetical protein